MATGLLSKNAKLFYKLSTSGSDYVEISDIQSMPSLGGTADKQEVTTLADSAHRYIKGLIEYGDLEFGMLYDNSTSTSNYRVCKGLDNEGVISWKVEFPDAVTSSGTGTTFEFTGESSTSTDEFGTNVPLTFKVTIALNSEITVTDPS